MQIALNTKKLSNNNQVLRPLSYDKLLNKAIF
jgi:hypothetical protein